MTCSDTPKVMDAQKYKNYTNELKKLKAAKQIKLDWNNRNINYIDHIFLDKGQNNWIMIFPFIVYSFIQLITE